MRLIITILTLLVAFSANALIPLRAQKYIIDNFRLDTAEAALIIQAAQGNIEQKEVDLATILAVIERESAYNHLCKSYMGCYGLMQVNYKVWKRELNIENAQILYDIRKNIEYGTKILVKYVKKYGLNRGLELYFGKSTKAKAYRKSIIYLRNKYEDLCYIPEIKKIKIIGGTN